jgi:ABC-2 type transport system ATP-binding protein
LTTGIEVEQLGKRFAARIAVEGLSFQVAPGEVFGLLGPNGAGKTTTVRMLTGLLRPTSGKGCVCGHQLGRDDPGLRGAVGLLTEQPGLYDRLSPRENLEFFVRLNALSWSAAWPRARRYLEAFGLGGREDDPCGSLSKGMRQKLALVRALVHAPQALFLDEPTSGLDPEAARAVRDAVAELASEGRTLVLCSHNLAEVERLCTRVAVVRTRLLVVAPVAQLRRAGAALAVEVEGEAGIWVERVRALPFAPAVRAEGSLLIVSLTEEPQAPDVISALVTAGARVRSATRRERPLEEVYLELMRA